MSLNSGSCWDILGIEPTNDKKAIKRAYHKLLRQYKPDEKPDEFKVLYQAYQDALADDEYDVDEEFFDEMEAFVEEIHALKKVKLEEPFELTKKEEETKDQEEKLYRDDQALWENFKARVDPLTYDATNTQAFNNIENWEFLNALTMQSSLETTQRFATYLFYAINDLDERCHDELLSTDVILYLNRFFLWDKQWQMYDEDAKIFEYLYPKVTNPALQEPYERASFHDRFYAFAIDIALVVLVFGLFKLNDTAEFTITRSTLFGIVIGYIFYVLIAWNMLGRRTIGFMLRKLRAYECYMVYDNNVYQGYGCEHPSWTARIARLILLTISLVALIQTLTLPHFSSWHLITLLNLYLLVQKKRILPDFSGTNVFKKDKD
jgi:hypothetical protein